MFVKNERVLWGGKLQLKIKKQKIIIYFKVKGVIHTLIYLKLVADALVE